MKFFFYICLLLVVTGCDNPLKSKMYHFGEEIELAIYEKAFIREDNLNVTFLDVLEDSRCPKNVNCVWAGNGEVEIQVNREKVQLNTYLEPHQVSISGIQVELISLEPYPDYPKSFKKEDYKVRLLITKI